MTDCVHQTKSIACYLVSSAGQERQYPRTNLLHCTQNSIPSTCSRFSESVLSNLMDLGFCLFSPVIRLVPFAKLCKQFHSTATPGVRTTSFLLLTPFDGALVLYWKRYMRLLSLLFCSRFYSYNKCSPFTFPATLIFRLKSTSLSTRND